MKQLARYLGPIVMIALVAVAWADGVPSAKPEQVGLSAERLGRVDAQVQADVDAGRIPGAVAMIARKGQVVYTKSFGKADTEKNTPMKDDALFRIYSMSKPITGVALMMLYEEGKFRLEDPISKFMPEFKDMQVLVERYPVDQRPVFNLPKADENGKVAGPPEIDPKSYYTVPAERPITVQDLLRHTAGFSYGFFGNTTVDKMYQRDRLLTEDKDLEDFASKLSKIPLQYQPGSTWHYSVAVDVQGRLVEVLSGMPFDKFLQERIFGPLGMNDTGFYAPEAKLDRLAQMYSPTKDGKLEPADPQLSRNHVKKPGLFSGGGGMVSTAHDYMRFCQMMLNGGQLDGVRLLSRKTVELMTIDHTGDVPNNSRADTGYGFGLGFAVAMDLAQAGQIGSVDEFNWGGAAGTGFWIDPTEEFIGVYMIQILPPPFAFSQNFKQLAYQSIAD